jgi:sulfur dioxygenase
MLFRQLIDFETNTYTYLIADEGSKEAALIDPVIEQVDRDYQLIKSLGLQLKYSIDTHVHADHITGTAKLRELTSCKGVVPEHAKTKCADIFFKDGEVINLGEIEIKAIYTPGHTDCHNTYLVNNNILLTGDSLFIKGCGRTDFQSGSSSLMYDSVVNKLFSLPNNTLVYPGHDYKGYTSSTIAEEKKANPRFLGKNLNQFIELMNNLNLPNPKKIMEAVAANQHCGDMKEIQQ